MSNWDKNLFIDHLREHCSREVAKVGVAIMSLLRNLLMMFHGAEVRNMDFNFSLQYRYCPLLFSI